MRTTWKELAWTIGSLGLFTGVYAYLAGWTFAIGFGLLILIHELGHVAAGAIRRIAITPPIFIPLVGAFVRWREKPHSISDEAFVAAGGPVAGLAASGLALAAWWLYPLPVLRELAFAGFAIHLLNLLPVMPFDGGRMVQAVSPWIGWIAVPAVVVLCALADASFLAWVIIGLAADSWQKRDVPAPVPAADRVATAVGYLVMCAVGYLGYWAMGGHLSGVMRFGRSPKETPDLPMALGLTAMILAMAYVGRAFTRFAERSTQRDRELIQKWKEQQATSPEER